MRICDSQDRWWTEEECSGHCMARWTRSNGDQIILFESGKTSFYSAGNVTRQDIAVFLRRMAIVMEGGS